MLDRKELLSACTTKTSTFKSALCKGEVKIRQLTMNETDEFNSILGDSEKNQFDAVCFAVKCSMIEPLFFTDDEMKTITKTGKDFIYETYSEIAYIGMTVAQRKKWDAKLKELLKVDKEISTDEEEEKKQKNS